MGTQQMQINLFMDKFEGSSMTYLSSGQELIKMDFISYMINLNTNIKFTYESSKTELTVLDIKGNRFQKQNIRKCIQESSCSWKETAMSQTKTIKKLMKNSC